MAGLRNWQYAAVSPGIVSSTAGVTVAPAAASPIAGQSGFRNYMQSVQINHDLLSAVSELVIRDGAGGTVLWRTKLQTAAVEAGQPIYFDPPLRGSTNTLMEVALSASVTGGVFVNAQGYVDR